MPTTRRGVVRFLRNSYLPGRARARCIYIKTCLYTLTPDRDFVLDTLPAHPGVCIAIGAGHAYKFASVIGRILSELAIDGATPSDHLGVPARARRSCSWRIPPSATWCSRSRSRELTSRRRDRRESPRAWGCATSCSSASSPGSACAGSAPRPAAGPPAITIWVGAWLLFYLPLLAAVLELSSRFTTATAGSTSGASGCSATGPDS